MHLGEEVAAKYADGEPGMDQERSGQWSGRMSGAQRMNTHLG